VTTNTHIATEAFPLAAFGFSAPAYDRRLNSTASRLELADETLIALVGDDDLVVTSTPHDAILPSVIFAENGAVERVYAKAFDAVRDHLASRVR